MPATNAGRKFCTEVFWMCACLVFSLTAFVRVVCAMVLASCQPAEFCNARFHGYKGDTTGEHGLKFAKVRFGLCFCPVFGAVLGA